MSEIDHLELSKSLSKPKPEKGVMHAISVCLPLQTIDGLRKMADDKNVKLHIYLRALLMAHVEDAD